MWIPRRSSRVVTAALLSLLACTGFGGCAGYQLAGSASDAREPEGRSAWRPRRLQGESLNLGASGCPLPPEPASYVIDILIEPDGTAKLVEFLRGAPTACVHNHVERVVSTWRFTPPPEQLRYSVGFSAPAASKP